MRSQPFWPQTTPDTPETLQHSNRCGEGIKNKPEIGEPEVDQKKDG